ncbi:hypothetical protein ABHN11_24775 [Brevibacillus centrosporus]|uniref:hypothetical protein n=1 Tax=Brevibacillus centrosporus TaxID=54910 RepID=UPI003D21D30D
MDMDKAILISLGYGILMFIIMCLVMIRFEEKKESKMQVKKPVQGGKYGYSAHSRNRARVVYLYSSYKKAQ